MMMMMMMMNEKDVSASMGNISNDNCGKDTVRMMMMLVETKSNVVVIIIIIAAVFHAHFFFIFNMIIIIIANDSWFMMKMRMRVNCFDQIEQLLLLDELLLITLTEHFNVETGCDNDSMIVINDNDNDNDNTWRR